MLGLFDIALIVVAIGLGLYILNKIAFKRIWDALSAWMGKGARAAWAADPVAVYKDKLEKITEELRSAVSVLEGHMGLIKQLRRRIDINEEQRNLIDARIKKCIDKDPKKAEQYAVELVKTDGALVDLKSRLSTTEDAYKQQSEKICKLKDKIVSYREKAGELESDLELSKAEAELTKMTQKFDATSLDFNDLGEIEDEIKNQIDKNRSKADVAKDLRGTDPKEEDEQEEKSAKVAAVLEKYKTKGV